MNQEFTHPEYTADAVLELYDTSDGGVSTCALLTPALKGKLRELEPGQVLEVRVDDPTAREDILSWSRLSGNEVLTMIEEGRRLRFYLRKK